MNFVRCSEKVLLPLCVERNIRNRVLNLPSNALCWRCVMDVPTSFSSIRRLLRSFVFFFFSNLVQLVTGGELFELLVKERGFGEEKGDFTLISMQESSDSNLIIIFNHQFYKARFFFRQLVEGVSCCHDQGICHRDLKVSGYQKKSGCVVRLLLV